MCLCAMYVIRAYPRVMKTDSIKFLVSKLFKKEVVHIHLEANEHNNTYSTCSQVSVTFSMNDPPLTFNLLGRIPQLGDRLLALTAL